jgi:hypothetical protein
MTDFVVGPETVFRWREGATDVAANPVAFCGSRAVLMDTAGRYHLADIHAAAVTDIIGGPVTVEGALALAEHILTGGYVGGSVTSVVNDLSLALAAINIRHQAEAEEGAA